MSLFQKLLKDYLHVVIIALAIILTIIENVIFVFLVKKDDIRQKIILVLLRFFKHNRNFQTKLKTFFV
jgi:hypothetical protein